MTRKQKEAMEFAAIDAALTMQKAGYKVNPQNVYDAMEYEKQIEDEGAWDDEEE